MSVPLSILDLAPIGAGQSARDSFAGSVALAQAAEKHGYRRVWYAEHHNMALIASSATGILIGHVAAHTSTIRLGSGGVMLPNHAPLTVAEQFGTLETLFPGRIDLGLGRAPGSDQATMRAMRRAPESADQFPQDVLELQAYLKGESIIPGVQAIPGAGTNVPLYILGSSLFGAQLAAAYGLPFAFASHFAPQALQQAVATYRSGFTPSEQLAEPYVMAGVTVIAADEQTDADQQFTHALRKRVRQTLSRGPAGGTFTDEQIDEFITTPSGRQIAGMLEISVAGTTDVVGDYLERFATSIGADELITVHQSPTIDQRVRSVELTASVFASV